MHQCTDRVFINVVALVAVNARLAFSYLNPTALVKPSRKAGGNDTETTHAEFSEQLAMALIRNQWVSEEDEEDAEEENNPIHHQRHPTGNRSTCRE
jgi:hypothetical protein